MRAGEANQSSVTATGSPLARDVSDRRPLRVAGLFAGIGGIELGLQRAGLGIKLLCEVDPAARRVLEVRFPGVPLEGDVASLVELPEVEVVAAGFPCQDLSQAGQTAGINGRQSGSVEHIFRLFRGVGSGPQWLLLENVPFMLHLRRGEAMRFLIRELQARGFAWAYRIIDTRAFGLPQRRRRVFLLASRTQDPKRVLIDPEAGEPGPLWWSDEACGFYWTEGNKGLGWAVDAVPPLKGGSGEGIPSPPGILLKPGCALANAVGFRVVIPTIIVAERLQGFEPEWTAPAVDDPERRKGPRWRLVGNAVSVPVAEWIGERLLAVGDQVLGREASTAVEFDLENDSPLPDAAWGLGMRAYRSAASTWPIRKPYEHLADFVEPTMLEALSAKATRGFCQRLKNSTLRNRGLLAEALDRHLVQVEEFHSNRVLLWPRGSARAREKNRHTRPVLDERLVV
jgi:DNA (cytosine-5)-methyltransferase 1